MNDRKTNEPHEHGGSGPERSAQSQPQDAPADDLPDPGRSAEREAQDHVIEHAAEGEHWLKQMWRVLRGSAGRPPPPDRR